MPTDTNEECFQNICHYIEKHLDTALSLSTLSQMAGLSVGHFQRRFKAVIGVSPKQYITQCRMNTFKHALREGMSVSEAIYDVGFGSNSRIYEQVDSQLGMTPTQYRRGGQGLSISYASASTAWGQTMLGATDRGLCFLEFAKTVSDGMRALKKEYPNAVLIPMVESARPMFDAWMNALSDYLNGSRPYLELPLDIQGTAFQRKVWHYLQTIPYGQVQSYTQVAQGIGQPKAARAVASACAANKLAIVIPCHRVIRGSGELGGYRWGLSMKRALLDREQQKI